MSTVTLLTETPAGGVARSVEQALVRSPEQDGKEGWLCETCGLVYRSEAGLRAHNWQSHRRGRESKPDRAVESGAEPDFNPWWDGLGERGRGAKLLFAAGLEKKASRYANCRKQGEKITCPRDHKFFRFYHGMNRFCSDCAPIHWARLLKHYMPLFISFFRDYKVPRCYTLARLTFTLRCSGEVITEEKVRAFNCAVKLTINRAVRRIVKMRAAQGDEWAKEAMETPRKLFHGDVFSDEVGYETRGHIPDERRVSHGRNLHCHASYFGPSLKSRKANWRVFRDIWRQETKRIFGEESHGVCFGHEKGWRSEPVTAVRKSFHHLLKYVSKVPYETLERMVELEVSFRGSRRVHTGGFWYHLPKEPEKEVATPFCPICEREGLSHSLLTVHHGSLPNGLPIPDYWPIKMLEGEGYRELDQVRRELALALVDARVLYSWKGG